MDQSFSDYPNQNGLGKQPPVTLKEEEMEYRLEKSVGTVTTPKNGEVINPQRFSNWRRLIRVTIGSEDSSKTQRRTTAKWSSYTQ